MREKTMFPYRLESAFFISLQFARAAELPDGGQHTLSAHLNMVDCGEFPDKLDILLTIETGPDEPMEISVKLVGRFVLVDGLPQPDHSIVSEFVNERALFQLWPNIAQMVAMVTGQMGVEPFRIDTPFAFDIGPHEPAAESEEEEC